VDVQRAILEGFATFFGGAVATVLFLLPGYVIGKAYSGGIRSPTPSDRAFLTTIASGGLLVHLIALPWTAPLAQYVIEKLPDLDLAHYLEVLAWSGLVLAILPAVIGAGAARIADVQSGPIYDALNFLGFTTAKRTAEAWNWVFREMGHSPDEIWLRVRLKNKGGVYYGVFGEHSLVSSDAAVRDVYLERTWPVDRHGQPKAASDKTENVPNKGIWVAGSEIMTVEFVPKQRRRREA